MSHSLLFTRLFERCLPSMQLLVGSALLLKLAVNRVACAVAAEHTASAGAAEAIASAASVAGALSVFEAGDATAAVTAA